MSHTVWLEASSGPASSDTTWTRTSNHTEPVPWRIALSEFDSCHHDPMDMIFLAFNNIGQVINITFE